MAGLRKAPCPQSLHWSWRSLWHVKLADSNLSIESLAVWYCVTEHVFCCFVNILPTSSSSFSSPSSTSWSSSWSWSWSSLSSSSTSIHNFVLCVLQHFHDLQWHTHTQTRSEPVSIFLKSDLEVSLRNYVHVVLRPASEWIPHAKRLCNLFSSFFHHHKALWPTKSFPGIAFLCSTFLRTVGKYGKIHRYGNKKPETECRHFIKAKKHYDRVFWFTQKLGRKRQWRLTPNFLVDAASNKIHRT